MFDHEGYESDKKVAEYFKNKEALEWLEKHKDAYDDNDTKDENEELEQN